MEKFLHDHMKHSIEVKFREWFYFVINSYIMSFYQKEYKYVFHSNCFIFGTGSPWPGFICFDFTEYKIHLIYKIF